MSEYLLFFLKNTIILLMNNDYDSSKGLPMGKKNPTGLLSVLITFMSSHRHPLIQFSILFLIGLGITNTSYAQAVISQSYGPVCENGTPIPLTGGPALSGTQKGRWTVESSTSGTIPIGILTSLIGAPFYIFLLRRTKGSGWV